MAAVLGSKNVKAIAVRGKAKTAFADAKALRTYVNETAEDVRTGTAALHKYGTPILVNMINKMGALGTRNLKSEIFENCEPISGEYMHDNFLDKHTTCLKCPVACGKNFKMKGGDFDGLVWKLPEYETIFALGTMLGIGDPGVMLPGEHALRRTGTRHHIRRRHALTRIRVPGKRTVERSGSRRTAQLGRFRHHAQASGRNVPAARGLATGWRKAASAWPLK